MSEQKDRPDLGKIAEQLYVWHCETQAIPIELFKEQNEIVRDFWLAKAEQIIALSPDIEDVRDVAFNSGYKEAMLFDNKKLEEAKREERERIYKEIEKHKRIPVEFNPLAPILETGDIYIGATNWQALKEVK